MADNYYDLTLRLDDLKHLFQAPELDPFNGQPHALSGLEQVINELKPRSLNRKVRLTLQLPPNQPVPYSIPQIQAAVACYCEARSGQLANDLVSVRWQGFKALQTGLVFLAACLLLSTLFDGLTVLPEFLRRVLGEGFLIVGWVSLWHPTELLLYEWWPVWRDKQLHERLKDMEIRIEAG